MSEEALQFCDWCHTSFIPRNEDHRFCCDSCRAKHHRRMEDNKIWNRALDAVLKATNAQSVKVRIESLRKEEK